MTSEEYKVMKKHIPLLSYIMNVTDACNCACTYCFTEPNPRVMSLDTAKQVVKFACAEADSHPEWDKAPFFCFFGGEPMLRYEQLIKPLLIWANESGLQEKYNMGWSITTNGTLLDDERLFFLNTHKVDMLFSMDGDKETQDAQRPLKENHGSSFDILKEKIPLILSYYPNITFRSTVQPEYVDKIFENYLFARECGFKNYFLAPNAFRVWTKEQLSELGRQLAKIYTMIYFDLATEEHAPLRFSELDREIMKLGKPKKGNEKEFLSKYLRCGIGTTSAGVSCDGIIIGCQEHNTHEDEDIFNIGNVFTGIDEQRHLRLLNEYENHEHNECAENPDRCQKCSLNGECIHPDCISRNIGVYNHANMVPEVNCYVKDFTKRFAPIWLGFWGIKDGTEVLPEKLDKYLDTLIKNGGTW